MLFCPFNKLVAKYLFWPALQSAVWRFAAHSTIVHYLAVGAAGTVIRRKLIIVLFLGADQVFMGCSSWQLFWFLNKQQISTLESIEARSTMAKIASVGAAFSQDTTANVSACKDQVVHDRVALNSGTNVRSFVAPTRRSDGEWVSYFCCHFHESELGVMKFLGESII